MVKGPPCEYFTTLNEAVQYDLKKSSTWASECVFTSLSAICDYITTGRNLLQTMPYSSG